MIARTDAAPDGDSSIEAVIRQRVASRADEWFPGQASSSIRVELLSRRPSCSLFVVHLGSERGSARILAKVRQAVPAVPAGGGTPAARRPSLGPGRLGAQEQTALEWGGLQSIHALFGTAHPTFGAIRPLDHLPDRSMILMDYVHAATLRRRLLAQSRLQVRRPTPDRLERSWRRAGQWLRAFQSLPATPLPPRQSTRSEVVDQFGAYHAYLTEQLGRRAVGDIATGGATLANTVLPERLPLATCHGDYAPRNMFLERDGRLTVFDPLPRWRVPRYEDLCRFLIGMRLLGLQVHSHGAAIGSRRIEDLEQQVICGYLADDGLPLAEIRCYQLLILLDKWSALVSSSQAGGNLARRVREGSLRLAHGYVRGQGRRILALAHSAGH